MQLPPGCFWKNDASAKKLFMIARGSGCGPLENELLLLLEKRARICDRQAEVARGAHKSLKRWWLHLPAREIWLVDHNSA